MDIGLGGQSRTGSAQALAEALSGNVAQAIQTFYPGYPQSGLDKLAVRFADLA